MAVSETKEPPDCESHRSESISEENGATADRDLLKVVKGPNHELLNDHSAPPI